MRPPAGASHDPGGVDEAFASALRVGEDAGGLRRLLEESRLDQPALIALLRRAVPVRLLEVVGTTAPWSEDARLLGAVVRNPRVPRSLGLKLLPYLFWRDLAEAAASPWVQGAIRVRAEGLLREAIPELRVGERITLARIATSPLLPQLLNDDDAKVVCAALQNPRLREEDLLVQLRANTVGAALIEEVAASRWGERYGIRLGLVLQPRTPLSLALSQLTSLVRRDLLRVAEAKDLKPLLQAAALRVAEEPTA
jgi:hypothetical protein